MATREQIVQMGNACALRRVPINKSEHKQIQVLDESIRELIEGVFTEAYQQALTDMQEKEFTPQDMVDFADFAQTCSFPNDKALEIWQANRK